MKWYGMMLKQIVNKIHFKLLSLHLHIYDILTHKKIHNIKKIIIFWIFILFYFIMRMFKTFVVL